MDRRQQKTKIAIHQAMTTLLKKKKFEALTVQDIIDEANIGRSTFYSHFETKEELLEEICREMFAHVFSKDLAPEKSHDFSKGRKGFALQFFTGSFCETIKWWINSDMKMPPEEVVENYQKMIKFR